MATNSEGLGKEDGKDRKAKGAPSKIKPGSSDETKKPSEEKPPPPTFEAEKDELSEWPYTTNAINNTLDIDLIVGRGKQLLFQSLSRGHLVAFAGSGLSIAYGRLSWDEWLDLQLDAIDAHAKAFTTCADVISVWCKEMMDFCDSLIETDPPSTKNLENFFKNYQNETRFLHREIEDLHHTFASLRNVKNTEHTVLFQVASQLHDLLVQRRDALVDREWKSDSRNSDILAKKILPINLHDNVYQQLTEQLSLIKDKVVLLKIEDQIDSVNAYIRVSGRPEAKRTFSEFAKSQLIDERAHAEAIIKNSLRYGPGKGRPPAVDINIYDQLIGDGHTQFQEVLSNYKKTLSRDANFLKDDPKTFAVLGWFKSKNLERLLNEGAGYCAVNVGGWRSIVGNIEESLKENGSGNEWSKPLISPTRRYLFEMLLALSTNPADFFGITEVETDPTYSPSSDIVESIRFHRNLYKSRFSIFDKSKDPIEKVVVDLGIRQFLTLNYDFEIERLFKDRGYSRPVKSGDSNSEMDDYRTDELGGKLRDGDFRRESASDLIAFSVDQSGEDASVFHLHGTADLNSQIVSTEREYSDLYLKRDTYRDGVDESLKVAFSANPLIFIGVGLSEADIMRPLRQFMSDQERIRDRTAVALRAADKSQEDRVGEAASLFLKYGVHCIYYGAGFIHIPDDSNKENIPEREKVPVDWLHWTMTLLEELETANKKAQKLLADLVEFPNKKSYDAAEKNECWNLVKERRENVFTPGVLYPIDGQRVFKLIQEKLGLIDLKRDNQIAKYDVLSLLFGRLVKSSRNRAERSRESFTRPEKTNAQIARCHFQFLPSDMWEVSGLTKKEQKYTLSEDPWLNLERQLLANIFKMTIAGDTGLPDKNVKLIYSNGFLITNNRPYVLTAIRNLNARLVALEGMKSAIHTGVFCAALETVERDWRKWREKWLASPPHRTPEFSRIFSNPNADQESKPVNLPVRYIRHHIDSVISPTTPYGAQGNDTQEGAEAGSPQNGAQGDSTQVGAKTGNTQDGAQAGGLQDRIQGDGTEVCAQTDDTQEIPDDPIPDRKWRTEYGDKPKKGEDAKKYNEYLKTLTKVRTFDTFVDALEVRTALDEKRHLLSLGRRMHLVAAERGVGKGAFLTAFFSNRGLGRYIASAWPTQPFMLAPDNKYYVGLCKKINPPEYCSALFVNLSFSTEVSSAFDMIVDAFCKSIANVELRIGGKENFAVDTDKSDVDSDAQKIHEKLEELPRIERINRLLDLYKDVSHRYAKKALENPFLIISPPRILLIINAVELLFYLEGHPKNREVRELLNLLTSTRTEDVPFDLIFISNENNIGVPAIRRSNFLAQRDALIDKMGNKDRNGVSPSMGVNDREDDNVPLTLVHSVRHDLDLIGLRNIKRRVERANLLLADKISLTPDDTPTVEFSTLETKIFTERQCSVHFARTMNPQEFMVDNFFPLALIYYIDFKLGKSNNQEWNKKLDNFGSSKDLKTLKTPNKDLNAALKGLFGTEDGEEIRKILIERYSDEIDSESFWEWKNLKRNLDGNRYCLTVLLAAAQQIALTQSRFRDGARAAKLFVRKTVDHVSIVGDANSTSALLSDVLDAYEQFHEIGKPELDFQFHFIILRHLAVIGTPVSAHVLLRLPEIRSYFDNLPSGHDQSRETRLTDALTTLCERGLVFRFYPHPYYSNYAEKSDKEEEKEHPKRYSIHRLLQLHIIKKMGAGPNEFIQINSFAPSIYASMPTDLPRLTQDGYEFLRILVASLSQYPDRRGDEEALESWHFGEAKLPTRIQALRAALSIVRSTYSVAVVSRFDSYDLSEPASLGEAGGFFEVYRIQVRWLIRKAWELTPKKADMNLRSYRPAKAFRDKLNAFYRDEIVWLYNECGVICLVQGNLHDAVALLRQALDFNSEIEGSVAGGAHHNRISLNLAVAQIERGRLNAARSRLIEICESEENLGKEKGRIWHIAYGYLGLLHHMSGDSKTAVRHYEHAIAMLRLYEDTRACSVFSRHFGDLERGRRDFKKARTHLNDAIDFAEAGGHEDMHKKARLAFIKLEIVDNEKLSGADVRSIAGRIRSIENYANNMEMPALACETSHIWAELLLQQGEMSLAGKLVSRSIAVAKQNDLNLRLNSALTLYAKILVIRDMPEQAKPLLRTCLDMAKRNNNQLEIKRVEAVIDGLHS